LRISIPKRVVKPANRIVSSKRIGTNASMLKNSLPAMMIR
jgi:hypothetical protein